MRAKPRKKLAVVACMDARLEVWAALGLERGDAHVIRNAGGVVTDDVIRSLAISQRLLDTEEVIVLQHTDCGMLKITDDEFKRTVKEDVGFSPPWSVEAFTNLDDSIRESMSRIANSPFLPRTGRVRGFIYDVEDGGVREVR